LKTQYYIIILMMCINCAAIILQNMGIEGVPIAGYSEDALNDSINGTDIYESWDWTDQGYSGDVLSGFRFLWGINVPIIESAFGMAQAFGAPWIVIDPLKAVWRFVWVSFVVELLGGFRISGD